MNKIENTEKIHECKIDYKVAKNLKIGATGFEPATSRPPAVRATKLRHTPQHLLFYQIFSEKSTTFLQ